MNKQFHPTRYRACDYLSMLALKLNHVSKMGPWAVGIFDVDFVAMLWLQEILINWQYVGQKSDVRLAIFVNTFLMVQIQTLIIFSAISQPHISRHSLRCLNRWRRGWHASLTPGERVLPKFRKVQTLENATLVLLHQGTHKKKIKQAAFYRNSFFVTDFNL